MTQSSRHHSNHFPLLMWLLLTITASCSAQQKNTTPQQTYTRQWTIVDSLTNNGFTQSALDSTEQIYQDAKKASNSEQMVKTLIYRMRLESHREDDAFVKSINRLTAEIGVAPFPAAPLLQSMLAECYWHYYQNNRWRFYDRTPTIGFKQDDINTWDLRTIMEQMTAAYEKSLQRPDDLRKIRLDTFGASIINGRDDLKLRPTLYDVLAHRAIDYFSIDDNELTKPAFEFTLNSAAYFKPFDDFVRTGLTTPDTASLKFHALRLLQNLTAFHMNDPSPEALIDVDLKRLSFVRQNSVLENRDSLYLGALQKLEHRFSRYPASTEVTCQIAQLYNSWAQTRAARTDERYRWMNREALTLCKNAVEAFPKSYGALQCASLAHQIRAKQLSFTVESVNIPGKPFKALLAYSNIGKVYWRQIPLPLKTYRDYTDRLQRDSIAINLAAIKPVKEWSTNVPDPGDYQPHSTEVSLPALPCGQYAVLCSSDPQFSCKQQAVVWRPTQISRISYLSRSATGGGQEFHLLDREKGTPLPGVSVTASSQEYDQIARQYIQVTFGTYISDQEGHVVLPVKKKQGNDCSIICAKGDDRLEPDQRFYLYQYQTPRQRTFERTFFFTDRAIYRPGQTIYFKGIMLSTDGDKSEIITGRKSSVTFYNVNGQEVAHLALTSNEYGSLHGSFTAPVNTLNGQMYIANGSGSQYFSVEDYKRPKFSVSIPPFEGSKRVDDSLRVTGRAVAYTGSAIDGAPVKYRIVREARFPGYWWCWWRPQRWSGEMEIKSGTTVTNDTGGFAIDFTALADKSIPQKENPIFSYTVSVDVTDITGETQSTTGSVSVGYNALTLSMDLPQQVSNASPLSIPVTTANCGGVFAPASGTITIYKLSAPATPYRTRLWERPDTSIMTDAVYHEQFPDDLFAGEDDITTWKRVKSVFKGEFDTQKSKELMVKGSDKWEPGVYVAEGKTKDRYNMEVTDTRYFTVFSQDGKKLPYPLADWFVPVKDKGEPGETAQFLVGSGYDNVSLLYEIEHKGQIVKKEWLPVKKSQYLIAIPIEEKHRGNISLHVNFVYNNRTYSHTATITVPWTNKDLDLSFHTFRDKLTPGEKEQWTLKIAGKNRDKITAEMVATLYDASLDAFTPHGWQFSIYPWYSAQRGWGFDDGFRARQSDICEQDWNSSSPLPYRYYPELNWFGYGFEGSYSYGRRGSAGIGYGSGFGGSAEGSVDKLLGNLQPSAAPPAPVCALAKSEKSLDVADDIDRQNQKSSEHRAGGGIPQKASNASGTRTPSPDLANIATRTNLNETAFFFPTLTTNNNGEILVNFQMPEALTRWNMIGFAHTKDLCYGQITNRLVTRKELMVVPNPPRFFRENDRITFTAKVSNLSDSTLDGTAQLFLVDATTGQLADSAFKSTRPQIPFTAKKGQSARLAWDLVIPEGVGAVTFKVVAKAKNFSDGEEQMVPILSNRMLVTESMPLPIRKKETKHFTLQNLVSQNNGSTTLRNHKLTLEFTANPAWYAIQALPYLIEYPYECAEQLFSRFYANSIAANIVGSSPRIKAVFDQWRTQTPNALLSNLEKNLELKSLALEETPWLLDGKDESERKKRVALLFDLNKMSGGKERALDRLQKMQLSNGGWPWFEGMPDDRYITQYIVTGLGKLEHLGVISISESNDLNTMLTRALRYLDNRIKEDYDRIKKHGHPELDNLSETHIQYLYMRSFFPSAGIDNSCKQGFDYFFGQAKSFYLQKRRSMQGMIALVLNRYNEKTIPQKIMRSLKENALISEEMGMYWKEMYEGYSWWWYEAPIETQALMIEAFDEVARDTATVEDLKVWLLKSKQTQNWPTTRSTAEACYALLLRGTEWLAPSSNVTIQLGNEVIDPAKRDDIKTEAGTGYFKIAWSGSDIKPSMGNVTITKQEAGVAWGSLYWQYFEQLDKIRPHETPLKLTKNLFLQQTSSTGPKITPITGKTALKPGDKLTVRIELRVDRDMEYVHMKDMRASGFEPLNVFSGYRWQDGLGYYESTRDAATNFFFSALGKGTYVFEYPLVVAHAGDFSNGITTIQCMYAPEFSSHSEGVRVVVGR